MARRFIPEVSDAALMREKARARELPQERMVEAPPVGRCLPLLRPLRRAQGPHDGSHRAADSRRTLRAREHRGRRARTATPRSSRYSRGNGRSTSG